MFLPRRMLIGCMAIMLVGCQDITPETQGKLFGGVLGGMVGNEIGGGSAVGTITGTLVGGMVGERVATSLKNYRPKISQTMEHSRSEVATSWQDPDGNVRYILVPRPAIKEGGRICRPFKLVIESDKGREVTQGVACRQGKENWLIQSE